MPRPSDLCSAPTCLQPSTTCCACGRPRCAGHALYNATVGEWFCWGDTLSDAQLQGGATYCEPQR
jgi:hypothetical protein